MLISRSPLPTLKKGDTIGVISPSYPSYTTLREKYRLGLQRLSALGFNVVEGNLSASGRCQTYRSGTPKQRADEVMELIHDTRVKGIIAAIGGLNTASILPHIDYAAIENNPKVICGYSDITALQMALLTKCGLRTYHGPSVTASFGEPGGFVFTEESFLRAVLVDGDDCVLLQPPLQWSSELIDARESCWMQRQRRYQKNQGWRVLRTGRCQGPCIAANLDTLLSLAGTEYFPDSTGCIAFLEETTANMGWLERNLVRLKLLGVLDKIEGLVFSKVDELSTPDMSKAIEALLLEVCDDTSFPIITEFDSGHTFPMLTIPQLSFVYLNAQQQEKLSITIDYKKR